MIDGCKDVMRTRRGDVRIRVPKVDAEIVNPAQDLVAPQPLFELRDGDEYLADLRYFEWLQIKEGAK